MSFGRFRERFGLMGYAEFTIVSHAGVQPETPEEDIMSWKKPKVVEVSLALEINSYASAELG